MPAPKPPVPPPPPSPAAGTWGKPPPPPAPVGVASTGALTTAERNTLINNWLEAKDQLEVVKALESKLRDRLAKDAALFDQTKLKGTDYYEMADGSRLKLERKLNYSLDNKNDACEKVVATVEKIDQVADMLIGRMIKWKPDISTKEYDELKAVTTSETAAKADKLRAEKIIALVDTVLTIKPGLPALSLVEPKTDA